MKFPGIANAPWVQPAVVGVWALAAIIFLAAPVLLMSSLGAAAKSLDSDIQAAANTQLAPKVEQRNIPQSVISAVQGLLSQQALGLNYVTLRNADRVILVSNGDLEQSLNWLPAGQARAWRGFFYRSTSFDRSTTLRSEGEIVGFIDYGIGTGRVLASLPLRAWVFALLALLAGYGLVVLFPTTSSWVQARFGANADPATNTKPAPTRASAKYQPADKSGSELQLSDQMGMGYLAVDGQGGVVDVNVNAARIMGFELRRLPGQNLDRLMVLEDVHGHAVESPIANCLEGKKKPIHTHAWLRRRDGKLIGIEMHAAQIPASARAAAGMLFWEVSEDLKARNSDSERAALAHTLLQNVAEAVLVTNSTGQILEANTAATRLLGYTAQGLKTISAIEILPNPLEDSGLKEMAHAAGTAKRRDGSALDATVSCMSVRWDGKAAFVLLIRARGVRSADAEAVHPPKADALPAMASQDPLTGLATHRHLMEKMARCFADEQTKQSSLLLLIDLVNFKQVNHEHGRATGDQVLTAFGKHLHSVCGTEHTAAHLGGDEFAVFIVNANVEEEIDEDMAMEYLKPLRVDSAKPLRVAEMDWELKIDVGMSIAPMDADNANELFQHAEAALYTLKQGEQHEPLLYAPGMNLGAGERGGQALRKALAAGALGLYLQPVCRAGGDEAIAASLASINWQPEQGEAVDHDQLWLQADEFNLLPEMTAWCLRRIAKEHAEWRNMGLALVPVFLPLPFEALSAPGLDRVVANIMSRYKVPKGALVLCVSGQKLPQEYVAPAGLRSALGTDFDTKQTTSAEFLWVNGARVQQLPDDSKTVAAIKQLGVYSRKRAKPIIAGPVENTAQHSTLMALGVGYVYGPHIGEPLKPRPFARHLAKQLTQPI